MLAINKQKDLGVLMKSGCVRLLVLVVGLVGLSGCTFYVGGSDAGAREAESASISMQSVAHIA